MPTRTHSASFHAEDAYRAASQEAITSIVGFLVDLLGSRLIARTCGVDVSSVSRWKSGQTAPTTESETKLRAARQIAALLLGAESDHTVRAWFIGMNPQLDDDAPIDVIRDGGAKEVLASARSYIVSM